MTARSPLHATTGVSRRRMLFGKNLVGLGKCSARLSFGFPAWWPQARRFHGWRLGPRNLSFVDQLEHPAPCQRDRTWKQQYRRTRAQWRANCAERMGRRARIARKRSEQDRGKRKGKSHAERRQDQFTHHIPPGKVTHTNAGMQTRADDGTNQSLTVCRPGRCYLLGCSFSLRTRTQRYGIACRFEDQECL